MEKRADNTFVGGLNTDRHPLASSKEELIEAFNIDLGAVGAGYQLILQKREGNNELLIYNPNTQLFESAGLPEGFIPLAVKEFNNVAYIISVNPDTGYGELGTFPSPDYAEFKYVEGADPIPTTITIGTGIYDPSAVPPPYGYSFVYAGPGGPPPVDDLVWIIVNPINPEIESSISVVTHLGYMPDSYDLSLDTPANHKIYYSINYNPIYTEYTGSPVTLNLGDTMSLAVSAVDPWLYEQNDIQTRVLTVTPTIDTTISTLVFKFHTLPQAQVRYRAPEHTPTDWVFFESVFRNTDSAFTANLEFRKNDTRPGTHFEVFSQPIIQVGQPGNWVSLSDISLAPPFQVILNGFPTCPDWDRTTTYTYDPTPGMDQYVRESSYQDGYLYLLIQSVGPFGGIPDENEKPYNDTAHWKRIGWISLNWDNVTTWRKGNVVRYLGECYIALSDNTNVVPDSDPLIWTFLDSTNPGFTGRSEYVQVYLYNGVDPIQALPIFITHTKIV